MKRQPKQIRLEEDMEAEIKKIADVTGLSQSEIIRQLITAGAKALRAHGYKFRVPLQVVVAPEEESTNPGRKNNPYAARADESMTLNEGNKGKKPSSSVKDIERTALDALDREEAREKSARGVPPKEKP